MRTPSPPVTTAEHIFKKVVAQTLAPCDRKSETKPRLLKFKKPTGKVSLKKSLKVVRGCKFDQSKSSIKTDPIRILDAPEISHDYYLNLLDWDRFSGLMAVCLGNTVYLWNETTAEI
jgi:hypothetical protein